MKKLIAPILICTVLFTACHNNRPTETVEETTVETTIETTVESTTETIVETTIETTVEETESTEPVETNLNGANEIVIGSELYSGYWRYSDTYGYEEWHFGSGKPFHANHITDVYDQTLECHIYDDNTLYAYLVDNGTLTGDCYIYSYSLDGDTLVMTKIGELGPDGTYYENERPDLYTWTFTRCADPDNEN